MRLCMYSETARVKILKKNMFITVRLHGHLEQHVLLVYEALLEQLDFALKASQRCFLFSGSDLIFPLVI